MDAGRKHYGLADWRMNACRRWTGAAYQASAGDGTVNLQGDLDVTVFQDTAGQGNGSRDAALRLAKGEKIEKKVYIPFQLVTPPTSRTS